MQFFKFGFLFIAKISVSLQRPNILSLLLQSG